MAINELFFDKFPAAVLEHQIQIRPYNAEKTRNMRSLNPEGTRFVGCFGFNGSFETIFQSVSSCPPERGRKKRYDSREKKSKQPVPHLLQALALILSK